MYPITPQQFLQILEEKEYFMSIIQLNIKDDVISKVTKMSLQKNISIEQFITNAIENEVNLYEQAKYLQMRSDRAKSFDLKSFMTKIPDMPPPKEDA